MTEEEEDSERNEERTTYFAATAEVSTNAGANFWGVPIPSRDFENLYEELERGFREKEHYTDYLEEHQDTIVVFFAVANEVFKTLGRQLFARKVIKPEYAGEVGPEFGRKQLFQLLRQCGIIDKQLFKDINDSIEYRDEFVHEPSSRHRETDLEKLERKVKKTYNAYLELSETDWEDF